MTEGSAKRALQKLPRPAEPSYEVGYAKPPAQTRFKSGQSGNPLGRPKGSKKRLPALNEERMKSVVIEEAYRMIGVRDGERLLHIPVIQAVIRSVALNAAKGHQKSQRMFAELLQWVERENKELYDTYFNTALDYKIAWEKELEHRKLTGDTGRDPIPHPDHIVIDVDTGLVQIRGPMTKQEIPKWDKLRRLKETGAEIIADFEEIVADQPEDRQIQKELRRLRRLHARVLEVLPD